MILPISIAQKLQQMLAEKTGMPASLLKHALVEKMVEDGVLQKRIIGKSKAIIFVNDVVALQAYCFNMFGINNLEIYIAAYHNSDISRSDAIAVSGNSKLKSIRTFKGFLVNCYAPVEATLNGRNIRVHPSPGSFTFISDWETFIPDSAVTIVGIENPENFREVQRQQYLFQHIKPLFISRFPQSHDAIKWLQQIPNAYLHFGDLDFAGINIYLNEYKKWLGAKASFFLPANTAALLALHGNRELYDRQLSLVPAAVHLEENTRSLISLLHQHKKLLEQEIFIV